MNRTTKPMNIQYPTRNIQPSKGKRVERRGHSDKRGSTPEFRIYAEAKASFSEREPEHTPRIKCPVQQNRQDAGQG